MSIVKHLKQTETNRERILASSSNEGSPEKNTPEENTPTESTPQILTPESTSEIEEDDNRKETELVESGDEEVEEFYDDQGDLLINTPEISLSPEISDNDSETESENTEIFEESNDSTSILQLLFETLTLPVNMGIMIHMTTFLQNIFGIDPTAPASGGNNIAWILQDIQAAEVTASVNVKEFHGKDDEDPDDWIRLFEAAFTASERPDGANGARKAVCILFIYFIYFFLMLTLKNKLIFLLFLF